MGISGLIVFVKSGGEESAIRKGHISEFKGKRVGVDVYSWIHKSIFTCAFDLFIGKPTKKYVDYCMRQIRLLTDNGVIPVLVFDGCNMPFKVVDKKRQEERQYAKSLAKDLIAAGKQAEAFKHIVKAVDVTHEMASEVIKAARGVNVDCIVAPYEADAQLAYLQKEGYIDIVITEDSDLIVFGCERIFYKMTPTGDGEIYERCKLPGAVSRSNIRFKDFNFDKFRHAAILSGCDYVKNLPGIGLQKAWKFMNITEITDIRTFLKKVPSYLKLKVTVDEQYINDFIMADLSFRYQYVFDPAMLQRVTFNPVEEHTEDFKTFTRSFQAIDVDHVQLALGNIDRNKRVYGNYNLNYAPLNSIFKRQFVPRKAVEQPAVKQLSLSFTDMKVAIKKRQNEILQEMNNEMDDECIINLYKSSCIPKRKEPEPALPVIEPDRKKPRKCKFVKSNLESRPLACSKFFNHNKENEIDPITKIEVIKPTDKLKELDSSTKTHILQKKTKSSEHSLQDDHINKTSLPANNLIEIQRIDDNELSLCDSFPVTSTDSLNISECNSTVSNDVSLNVVETDSCSARLDINYNSSSKGSLTIVNNDSNLEPVVNDTSNVNESNDSGKSHESIVCNPDMVMDNRSPSPVLNKAHFLKPERRSQKNSNLSKKKQAKNPMERQLTILDYFRKTM